MNWLQKASQTTPMDIQGILGYLEQSEGLGYFKYVRCNGEYRFSPVEGLGLGHKELAGTDIPESAGFLSIKPDGFQIRGHSDSLRLGPDSTDESNLSRLLSMSVDMRRGFLG